MLRATIGVIDHDADLSIPVDREIVGCIERVSPLDLEQRPIAVAVTGDRHHDRNATRSLGLSHHTSPIFPCDFGDGDYLRITCDDDPEWRYLWIEAHMQRRLRSRFVAAMRVLLGTHYQASEIVLTDKVVADLADYLTSKRS